jgi:predicted phage terminase large subunit-like protein
VLLDKSDLERIKLLPPNEQRKAIDLAKELVRQDEIERSRVNFMDYVHHMWPQFIEGHHHRIMADTFDRVIKGECKRVIINMGPRHTKSEFASYLLPSYYMGHFPDRKIMQLTHTADLSVDFGGRVRDLIASQEYHEVFPHTELKSDAQAAGRWRTDRGGVYVAMGIGGKLAGKGADLLIIDDAHSEQEYIRSLGGDTSSFDQAFEWYQTGPRQRLQPNAAIVIVMTRWHKRDLTGRLIERMTSNARADQWEVIEFPAILPSGKALWPEFWSLEELESTREELTAQQWNAQYLQHPTSEEGALVKREWWKIWDGPAPECEFIIQAWDTAFGTKTINDYSACTTWGVFFHESEEDGMRRPNIILLDAWRGRIEFPDLKRKAIELWRERQPDAFLVEAKASGSSLIQELRRMGIPVQDVVPVRGTRENPNDKISRVNNITDIFASGAVWRPNTRWAEEVAEECAAFPSGDHDDFVDTTVMAMKRFRDGGFITLKTDDFGDSEPLRRIKADYY